MADERKSGYCRSCKKRNVVFRPGTSHLLHLFLSIITAGIWLIVWLLSTIKVGGWRCSACGSRDVIKVR